MEPSVDEPPLSNTERLVLVAQEAHENLHDIEASVRAISNVAANLLLRASPFIEAIIQNPRTVSSVFGARALDCIYGAEYFVAVKNEALKPLRKNVQDVTVRLCWRGTDPNDDEGMIRAFQRAFMRDVQGDDEQMVSRLMNANRHLAGERPGQKARRRVAPREDAVFVRWAWIRMCLNILARPNHMQRELRPGSGWNRDAENCEPYANRASSSTTVGQGRPCSRVPGATEHGLNRRMLEMLYDFLNTTSYYTRLPDQSSFSVQPNAMTGLAWCCRARHNCSWSFTNTNFK